MYLIRFVFNLKFFVAFLDQKRNSIFINDHKSQVYIQHDRECPQPLPAPLPCRSLDAARPSVMPRARGCRPSSEFGHSGYWKKEIIKLFYFI
jgi:hypothetical protein